LNNRLESASYLSLAEGQTTLQLVLKGQCSAFVVSREGQ